jgi:hypothetical protein
MEVKTAVIAAFAGIISAALAAGASIYVGTKGLKEATATLTRYVYDNGAVSSTSLAGGKIVVIVNGSNNNGPVGVPIDMDRLTALCSDADGCTLTLGATRFTNPPNPEGTGYVSDAALAGSPCRFFYTRSKQWSLSQSCVAIYGLYQHNVNTRKYEFNRVYQIYEYSSTYGTDDSAGTTDPDGQPLNIMSFKGARYLTESAPDLRRRGGTLVPDDPKDKSGGKGLYLIASSPDWDCPGAYPNGDPRTNATWPVDDPGRQCILIVED